MEFRDRRDAGRALAKALGAWRGRSDVAGAGAAARRRAGGLGSRAGAGRAARRAGGAQARLSGPGRIRDGRHRIGRRARDGRICAGAGRCRSRPSRPWSRANRPSWRGVSGSTAASARRLRWQGRVRAAGRRRPGHRRHHARGRAAARAGTAAAHRGRRAGGLARGRAERGRGGRRGGLRLHARALPRRRPLVRRTSARPATRRSASCCADLPESASRLRGRRLRAAPRPCPCFPR